SAFSYVSVGKLSKIKIPLPPIEKQQEIVDELDNYQEIVDGAKQIIDSYEPQIEIEQKWGFIEIEKISEIRPKKSEISKITTNKEVSFVPMSILNDHNPNFSPTEKKIISEVFQGYTYFRDNDVLLAKITPCFENGKSGIAKNLKNGIGFGSTEFIVIRANQEKVLPDWVYYFISQQTFIDHGKKTMTGSAGQQRININFVKNYKIPVPKIETQKQLISQINNERSLIQANIELTKIMNNKIQKKLNFIWGK
ncbi:MAG: restriction endonuclease subunit M/S, partial [Candidatus Cloacimonetes bacterium]|nr:restriction endonuclease subunit M/S [Candidatus Cloacimonadota bacterium]